MFDFTRRVAIIIAVYSLLWINAFSQHSNNDHNVANYPQHKISFVMANSLINQVLSDNSNGLRLVPTYGLNYDFLFHEKWGVGLHNDIIIQQFKVENHNNHKELIRENPVAICGVVLFKPLPKISFLGGYGIEIESHENIQLLRFGLDYGIHLPDNWELGIMVEYDYKIKSYSSLMFGVGFSKLFGGQKDLH